ncbi:MAG: HD domain-containing protein [Aigarchaeota archaeon]|nr:HD domain-containing protein [Aigarchaeota archaeon]MDW8093234.1 HD domain-containing protein [Nitrososphaerota archaeon]
MAELKLIKDPVHGYITLKEDEICILDTYPLQRLRRISQLPFVYLVYPGARHSRFDHSIGCFHLAKEMADHLALDEEEAELLKVSSLLHDVGHTPYSHLLEPLLMESNLSHEGLSIRIIEEYGELRDSISNAGISVHDVTDVLRGKVRISPLVSGPLDVDRLDFLVRDAYFTGATYGVVDIKRIIHLTRLTDAGPTLDVRGWGVAEELALARYHSFMNVYFHHTVRAAQVMFLRGAKRIKEDLGVDFGSMSIEEYLSHDDYSMWSLMKNYPKTRSVISRIERRLLPKLLYEVRYKGEESPEFTNKQEELEYEISQASRADPEKVYVDSSHAPPLLKYGPQMLKLHSDGDERGGVDLWVMEMVSRPFTILRVYVDRDVSEVERVREAARSILSKT